MRLSSLPTRGRTIIAAIAMLLAVPFAILASPAQANGTEVIAVRDITSESECIYTAETYADKAQTVLMESKSYPCLPGSVLHAERMTQREAQARGIPFVVSRGDPVADEAAVDNLKADLVEAIRGPVPTFTHISALDANVQGDCGTPTYRNRSQSYNALGGTINFTVKYHDVEDSYPYGCNAIVIYESYAYLSDALNPGEDLFWDEERYGGWLSSAAWDMGCQEFNYGSTNRTTYMSWFGEPNYWLTDESINDTSLGCDYWGEEYTGYVYLDG